MKRRGVIAGSIVALVLAGGVAYHVAGTADDAAPPPVASPRQTAALGRASHAHADRAHKPTGHVDIARVEAAIARMHETSAKISREQIIAEQQKMLEAKAKFEAIQVAPPQRRVVTDDHGTRWAELTYASGEVRYEFATDDDAAQAAPAPAR